MFKDVLYITFGDLLGNERNLIPRTGSLTVRTIYCTTVCSGPTFQFLSFRHHIKTTQNEKNTWKNFALNAAEQRHLKWLFRYENVLLRTIYKMSSRSLLVYKDTSASHEYVCTLIKNGHEFCKLLLKRTEIVVQ